MSQTTSKNTRHYYLSTSSYSTTRLDPSHDLRYAALAVRKHVEAPEIARMLLMENHYETELVCRELLSREIAEARELRELLCTPDAVLGEGDFVGLVASSS